MSLTADTADAIIAVDRALARFEQANAIAVNSRAYHALKSAIAALQEVACGDGTHFASVDEARAYASQPVVSCPSGTRWCVGGCGNYLPVDEGFRCGNCRV